LQHLGVEEGILFKSKHNKLMMFIYYIDLIY